MYRVRIIAVLSLLVTGGFVPVAAQDASLRLIESGPGRSLYELNAEWGDAEPSVGGLLEISEAMDLPSLVQPSVRVLAAEYDEYPFDPVAGVGGEAATIVGLGLSRKRPVATLLARLVTYDLASERLRRYRRMRIEVTYPVSQESIRRYDASDNPHLDINRSVLADGGLFKIAISETGMYRIDRTFLESLPGLGASVGNIDPDQIRVFGNGGAPVPALNSAPRIARFGGESGFCAGVEEMVALMKGMRYGSTVRGQVDGIANN